MSASSTRVAVATVVVVVVALAGWLGWRHLAPAPLSQFATSVPNTPTVGPAPSRPPSEPAASAASAPISDERRPEVAEQIQPAAPAEIGKTVAVPSGENASAAPSFDIVRVEPSGEALLAGRSQPNDPVALVSGGKVVAETRADAGGNFVITPPTLKPGDYALSLRAGQGAAAKESRQSVVVSVPATKAQQVVVAMAEPGKPTAVLSALPQSKDVPEPARKTAEAVPTGPAPKLAISSVELENGSGLFATGTAPPGTDVRVYLNDSRVADVIAAAAGRWTVSVRKGLSTGRYAVRADSLKADRTVAARVEVPFEVPTPMIAAEAEAPAGARGTPASSASIADADPAAARSVAEAPTPSPADVVVDELTTEIVARGDNLWRISRKRLGFGTRYTEIYAANAAQIRDPKLVYPGQVFVLPHE